MTAPAKQERSDQGEVTRILLARAGSGEVAAADELLPLVYRELRELARRELRGERGDVTLQATALVHEAYLRLVGEDGRGRDGWKGRGHFYAAAAEAMRRILVDQARRRGRLKRGGGRRRVGLEEAEVMGRGRTAGGVGRADELLALDEALTALAGRYPERARLVSLRYFAGLTNAQAAEVMGVSAATGERYWAFARAWLYRRMGGGGAAGSRS